MRANNLISVILFGVLVISGCGSSYKEEPSFKLYDRGTEDIVNYSKYGEFHGIGTSEYNYIIKDQAGLSKAVGEGIHPNGSSIVKDPDYNRFKKTGKLDGTHWEFINSTDYQANFYKWATASEERGVKLFYTAFALEKAGHIRHAIKAYYSLVVNYPRTIGWTYWHTPWPVAQVAIDKINYLCKKYPQMGWKLTDASIIVKGGYDDSIRNDAFIVNPGKIIRCKPNDLKVTRTDLSRLDIVKTVGTGRIRLIQ